MSGPNFVDEGFPGGGRKIYRNGVLMVEIADDGTVIVYNGNLILKNGCSLILEGGHVVLRNGTVHLTNGNVQISKGNFLAGDGGGSASGAFNIVGFPPITIPEPET